MKSISRLLALCCAFTFFLHTAGATEDASRKQMLKEAKVDRTHAELIAVSRARSGKATSSKIERSHGRLVWTVQIALPNNGATQVQVNALTGKVVAIKPEKSAR